MKRYTKDKTCLWIFLIYLAMATIILGVGFFYGDTDSIGTVVTGNGTNATICNVSINQDFSACLNSCDGTLYLQKVCLTNISSFTLSTQLSDQVSMYNVKYCFTSIVYTTAGLLVVTGIFYLFIICIPKVIYFYIACVFFMLLGLAFFILKNLEIRESANSTTISSGNIFYNDERTIATLSYLLLAVYLLIFPLILFSPKKIRMAAKIIGHLQDYYYKMMTMNIFTLLIILIVWGLLLLEIFLVMHFFTAGTSTTATDSFFYIYQGI